MNLILDTSTENLVVILENDGKYVASDSTAQVKHQEFLLPEIEKILDKNKVSLKDITCIGVVVGPGSFTGVRLAVATAKAFCYVYQNIKLVGIDMLDFLDYLVGEKCKKSYACFIKCTATKSYVSLRKGKTFDKFILGNNNLDSLGDTQLFALNMDKIGDKTTQKLVLTPLDYVNYFKYKFDKNDFADFRTLSISYMALSQAEENLKNGGHCWFCR